MELTLGTYGGQSVSYSPSCNTQEVWMVEWSCWTCIIPLE